MNASSLTNPIQAYDDALQARQEALDKACDAAQENAIHELTFDELLQALSELPYHEKAKALREASSYQATRLLAETYIKLFNQKTNQALQQATECARQIKLWKAIKQRLTLSSEEK